MTDETEIKRVHGGRFAPGVSANKAGRPKGAIGKTTELRHMILSRCPEIIQTLIDSAIAGDVHAAKILIDRSIAPIKSESLPVSFQLPENGNLRETGEVVLKLMSEGDITADQANTILSALSNQAKLVEISDLEAIALLYKLWNF